MLALFLLCLILFLRVTGKVLRISVKFQTKEVFAGDSCLIDWNVSDHEDCVPDSPVTNLLFFSLDKEWNIVRKRMYPQRSRRRGYVRCGILRSCQPCRNSFLISRILDGKLEYITIIANGFVRCFIFETIYRPFLFAKTGIIIDKPDLREAIFQLGRPPDYYTRTYPEPRIVGKILEE